MTIAEELRALAERVPADGPPAVTLARLRAVRAAEPVAAALTADPTLAERQQRWLDVLAELLRRLTPLARQASAATECVRLSAAGDASTRWPQRNWTRYRPGARNSPRRSLPRPGLPGIPRSASASYRPAGCPASTSWPRSPPSCAARSRRPWTLPTRTRKPSGSRSSPTRSPSGQIRGVVPELHLARDGVIASRGAEAGRHPIPAVTSP